MVVCWLNRCCIGRIRCLRISRRRLVCSFIHGSSSCLSSFHYWQWTAALYFVGGVRVTFSTGIAAGGNLAYWYCPITPSTAIENRILTLYRTSYLVTMVFTYITAAVVAEVCSASPSAGSIYLWAAEAGGPRFGRLFGFIVAWWSTTAWTTFCASMLLLSPVVVRWWLTMCR